MVSEDSKRALINAMGTVLETKFYTQEEVELIFADMLNFVVTSGSVIEIIAHLESMAKRYRNGEVQ